MEVFPRFVPEEPVKQQKKKTEAKQTKKARKSLEKRVEKIRTIIRIQRKIHIRNRIEETQIQMINQSHLKTEKNSSS